MEQPDSHYNDTICESKELSIAKAMEIMLEDIEKQRTERVLVRPDVSVWKGAVPIVLYLASLIALLVLSKGIALHIHLAVWLFRVIVIVLYLGIIMVTLKPLLIWMIEIYQRFAPEKTRKLCYFEPSCSEYMKLAIQKYGVFRGVYKGCNRLMRCHWPNGGEDYP